MLEGALRLEKPQFDDLKGGSDSLNHLATPLRVPVGNSDRIPEHFRNWVAISRAWTAHAIVHVYSFPDELVSLVLAFLFDSAILV